MIWVSLVLAALGVCCVTGEGDSVSFSATPPCVSLDEAGDGPFCINLSLKHRRETIYTVTKEIKKMFGQHTFLVDLTSLEVTTEGVTFFAQLKPFNQFLLDADLDIRVQADRPPTETDFSHAGQYRVQLAPHEVDPRPYYVTVTNAFNGPLSYELVFSLDIPDPVHLGVDSMPHGGEGNGQRIQYYYYEPAAGGHTGPLALAVQMLDTGDRLEETCEKTMEHGALYDCFLVYFQDVVSKFYGTAFPMCKAHQLVVMEFVADCRVFAALVGQTAFEREGNVYEAYAMCPVGLCFDGCKTGVVDAWTVAHYDDESFHLLVTDLCQSLADGANEACVRGFGAGILAQAEWDVAQALVRCESVASRVSVTEDAAATWTTQCARGVFQKYMDRRSLALATDVEYANEFASFCDGAVPSTPSPSADKLLQECYEERGANAAHRGNLAQGVGQGFCDKLMSNAAPPGLAGIEACLKAVSKYKNLAQLQRDRRVCPFQDTFHSSLYYNLPEDFTEGAEKTEQDVKTLRMDWLTTFPDTEFTETVDPVIFTDKNRWWFSIDPNRAQITFLVNADEPGERTSPPSAGAPSPPAGPSGPTSSPPEMAPSPMSLVDRYTDALAFVLFLFSSLKMAILIRLRATLKSTAAPAAPAAASDDVPM